MIVRIALPGDLHCGHIGGLCPPEYWSSEGTRPEDGAIRREQKRWWTRYESLVKRCCDREYDRLVVVLGGDLIDGPGKRSGGVELLTTDPSRQAEIAHRCLLEFTGVDRWLAVYGTPYHTGEDVDFERGIVDALGGTIHNVLFARFGEFVLNARHKTGGSQTPVGGDITSRKKVVQGYVNAGRGIEPVANLYARWHVHRYSRLGTPGEWSCIMPSLQSWTQFGGRQCDRPVTWGMVWIDVDTATGDIVHWHDRRDDNWWWLTPQASEIVEVC